MLRSILVLTVVTSWAASSFAGVSASGALSRKLPDVSFTAISLADAVDFLRDASGANVHVNWRAIEEAGISKDAPVSIRLRGAPLRKVLNLILAEAAGGNDVLTFYVSDGVIEITTQELADADLFTRVYPVEDLLVDVPDFKGPDFNLQQASQQGSGGGGGGGSIVGGSSNDENDEQKTKTERAQELMDLITSLIRPEVWRDNGGTASIRFINGSLVVTAPRSVHEALGGPVD